MYTTTKRDYELKNTILIKGRGDWKYRIHSMRIKDAPGVMSILPDILRFLMLNDVFDVLFCGYQDRTYEANDQYDALCEIIALATEKPDAFRGFDLQMAKVAVVNYIDMLRGDVKMQQTIQCGTKVIDREGNEFMAYSYKLTDYRRALDLLDKVNFISTAANFDTKSYNAMIEIIYLALDGKVDVETIEKSIDAEFARKVLAVYYDVNGLFEQAQ
jgi:uncharacterized protein YnzC (UPF0291/DUF896 family)